MCRIIFVNNPLQSFNNLQSQFVKFDCANPEFCFPQLTNFNENFPTEENNEKACSLLSHSSPFVNQDEEEQLKSIVNGSSLLLPKNESNLKAVNPIDWEERESNEVSPKIRTTEFQKIFRNSFVHKAFYVCTYNQKKCLYSTRSKTRFEEHARSHCGYKPVRCTIPGCKYRTVREGDMKKHLIIHTDIKNFPCPYKNCRFRARYRQGLVIHLRKHTGHRPYVCEFPNCTSAFTQPGNLKRHQIIHASKKNHHYCCRYCPFVHQNEQIIHQHIVICPNMVISQQTQSVKPYHICRICNKIYKTKCDWIDHFPKCSKSINNLEDSGIDDTSTISTDMDNSRRTSRQMEECEEKKLFIPFKKRILNEYLNSIK
ncbi:hypothetical protein SNEBB_009272 [Seison nebaliae]|nr:hypothetical protein SNEBB_009272 [Seison nebaliae]